MYTRHYLYLVSLAKLAFAATSVHPALSFFSVTCQHSRRCPFQLHVNTEPALVVLIFDSLGTRQHRRESRLRGKIMALEPESFFVFFPFLVIAGAGKGDTPCGLAG